MLQAMLQTIVEDRSYQNELISVLFFIHMIWPMGGEGMVPLALALPLATLLYFLVFIYILCNIQRFWVSDLILSCSLQVLKQLLRHSPVKFPIFAVFSSIIVIITNSFYFWPSKAPNRSNLLLDNILKC